MMPSINPYSPGRPVDQDPRFVDRDRAIERVKRCLNTGKSCSIIGGVGMGKTSILKRLKWMFSQGSIAAPDMFFRFIPIYFKPDLQSSDSLRSIYQQLISRTISQVKDWLRDCVTDVPGTVFEDLKFSCRLMQRGSTEFDEDCRAFEGDFWEIIKAIRHAAANTKLLFLLDEAYRIGDVDVKEALARHWFELLDEDNPHKETLRSHLAVVITCRQDHLDEFIPRKPTVPVRNTIEPIYLRLLEQDDAWRLMKFPFEDTLGEELVDDVAEEIYSITGGHPLLLQSAMSDLWIDARMKKGVDVTRVRGYISAWSEKHPEMYREASEMIDVNPMLCSVADLLLTDDRVWERAELDEELSALPIGLRRGHELRDVMYSLQCLGVIREVGRNAYQVSGHLFREWLRPFRRAESEKERTMPEQYLDFEVHINPGGHAIARSQEGDVVTNVPTDVPNPIRLSMKLIDKGETDRSLLKTFGQELYDWLFPGPVHTHFQQTEAVARAHNVQLRIRLNIEADNLASLPLEFIYRSSEDYFLACNPDTVLSRYLNLPLPQNRARRREGPLHLLVIIANPSDQIPLKPDEWEDIVLQALDVPIQEKQIEIQTVKQATFREIRNALLQQKPDIVQFVGHGIYRDGKGYLALVDENTGETWAVDDERFANIFLGSGDHLGLVSLATCESAKSDSPQGFLGIAPKIVQRGTPAVVAMQYRVRVKTAKVFLENFYAAIAARKPVDWAVQWARNAISIDMGLGNREFATPVLYMRAKNGEIF